MSKPRHHHRPTAAERRAEARREAAERARQAAIRAEQEREAALRRASWTSLANEIHAWRDEIGPNPQSDEQLISPVMVDCIVSSERGEREQPNMLATRNHPGADMRPVNRDEPHVGIRAAMSGRVLFAGRFNSLLGNAVFIGAANGDIHIYGHLNSIDGLQPGQRITQGQPIGEMGTSGNTTARCLHFVIRRQPGDALPNGPIPYNPGTDMEADALGELIQRVQTQAPREERVRDFFQYELVDAMIDGEPLKLNTLVRSRPAPDRSTPVIAAAASLAQTGVQTIPADTSGFVPFIREWQVPEDRGGLIRR